MGFETPSNDEVAGFLADVRAAYLSDPDEDVASRHLAAIASEVELVRARRGPQPATWRKIMDRNRFLRPAVRLAVATGALVLGTASLAVAGVDLPDPAANAFERAGISLPNQAGGNESGEQDRSDEVRSVIEATPPSERRGCAFGHRVAEAAKGSPLPEPARENCARGDENGGDDAENTSSNQSDFGRETAEKARGLGDATVEERRTFGKETADRAKQLGGPPAGTPGAEHRSQQPPAGGTTGPPDGTPSGPPDDTPAGPPEGTPTGPPDSAPIPDGTPTGPPDGTPGGRP